MIDRLDCTHVEIIERHAALRQFVHVGDDVTRPEAYLRVVGLVGGAATVNDQRRPLAERIMLTPSGLRRLVDRLEREHLVERQSDPTDLRSVQAVLTEAGLRRLDESRVTHNAVIRSHFTDHLTAGERRRLGKLWERVRAAASRHRDSVS